MVDGSGLGIILNDDPVARTIMAIQGEGHHSAFVGQPVITTGIVTAVDTNGFYLQDPTGDGNARTSDGIFIKTAAAPTVKVGDALSLTGVVGEYKPSDTGLSVTQVTASDITILSSGNALPAAVLIGTGGLLPPTESIDSDGLTVFNPEVDGIDFWETLEGMRVTIDTPIAVANSNEFGETDIVASAGVGATGINERGGITISRGRLQSREDPARRSPRRPADAVAPATSLALGHRRPQLQLRALRGAGDRAGSDHHRSDARRQQHVLKGDANYVSVATYNRRKPRPVGHQVRHPCQATSSTASRRPTSSRCRKCRTPTARATAQSCRASATSRA